MRIQRLPEGLLQLLDLQSSGLSPSELESRVQPVLDFLPFYTGQVEATAQGSSVSLPTSGSAGVSLAVPPGQLWLLRYASLTVGFGAAGQIVPLWRLERGSANAYLPVTTPGVVTMPGVALSLFGSWEPSPGILLRGGDRFTVEAGGVFGTPACFGFVTAYYARLA